MAYPNARNRNMVYRSSTSGSTLRVFGLLLALASMILAVLAAFFFLQSLMARLLAVIILLFAARIFALWLGASRPGAKSTSTAANQPWMPATYAPDMPGQIKTGVLPPAQLPTGYAETMTRATGHVPSAVPTSSLARPALSPYSAFTPAQSTFDGNEATRQPESESSAVTGSLSPYVPIAQDPLFQLDMSIGSERCFLLAKEGEPLVECQDRYALRVDSSYRCYAVADGVAGSFVPGPWARIVAQSFVERAGYFAGKDDFLGWLADCGRQWHAWMAQRWVPTINDLRARNGDGPGNWSNDIRQGAQTTLIGCTLTPTRQFDYDAATVVNIFAVGDGELFLFSPHQGGWYVQDMFPFDNARDFDAHPDTLVTAARPDLAERAWARHKAPSIEVHPGELLVLTTDTLAKWILTQIEQHSDRWEPLLSMTDPGEFEQYIRREFHRDQVEDDDLTMLVIPV